MRNSFGASRFLAGLIVLSLAAACGADLRPLTAGAHVRLSGEGYGPLCEAKVLRQSPGVLILELLNTAADCGRKHALIMLRASDIEEVAPVRTRTVKRNLASAGLAAGGAAAFAFIPFAVRSQSAFALDLLAHGALGGFVFKGAWRVVPGRRDYVLLIRCQPAGSCLALRPPLRTEPASP